MNDITPKEANGTPYNPTGDCISRDALRKFWENRIYNHVAYITSGEILASIDNAPTVKEISVIEFKEPLPPVKAQKIVKALSKRSKGEWKTVEGVDGDEHYECSNCGEPWVLMAGTPKDNNMNFCPNCGADMRGDAE